jgi:hypothetical protein
VKRIDDARRELTEPFRLGCAVPNDVGDLLDAIENLGDSGISHERQRTSTRRARSG